VIGNSGGGGQIRGAGLCIAELRKTQPVVQPLRLIIWGEAPELSYLSLAKVMKSALDLDVFAQA
jgi:hypothetical protein